jgi:hypothetical protein
MSRAIKQFDELGMPEFVTKGGNRDRHNILEDNKALRDGRLPKPRNLGDSDGFAGVALRIPELDYAVIKIMFPDDTSPDHEIRTKAWQKFARDPASEPYRVQRKTRGPQCRSITAR